MNKTCSKSKGFFFDFFLDQTDAINNGNCRSNAIMVSWMLETGDVILLPSSLGVDAWKKR